MDVQSTTNDYAALLRRLSVYKLELYSERDGLWHLKGLFSSRKNARRYADGYDCYIRITHAGSSLEKEEGVVR